MATPLVVAFATARPFAAEPGVAAPTHMLGPSFPILAGGTGIVPIRSGTTISFPNDWACGNNTSNVFALSNPDSSGRFRSMSRDNGFLHQTLTISAFANGAAQQWVMTESRFGVTVGTTTISLIDANADGVYEAVSFSGQVNTTISFVSTGSTISIPWAQASTIGINTTTCAGALPQLLIPLADTNGDGQGDAIVMDLDGNGVPDGDLFSSAPIGVPSVPTMGPTARLLLMLLLGATGTWFLSRRPGTSAALPA